MAVISNGPIQAHKMIVKAVKNGVKPERIAKALSMPMETVNTLINLLDGVNAEATELLRDKHITAEAIRLLRKVSSLRQIEIAEVMVSANNFTKAYPLFYFGRCRQWDKYPNTW